MCDPCHEWDWSSMPSRPGNPHPGLFRRERERSDSAWTESALGSPGHDRGWAMRRFWLFGLACVMLAPVAGSAQNLPPHAWLFGTWGGGMFPPIAGLSSQACFSQPVVIFTRDLVVRATLTEQTLAQRVVETARTSAGGVEFRFGVTGASAVPPMFGGSAQRV